MDILPTAPQLFDNMGHFKLLSDTVIGTNYFNRVGTKIRLKSCYITGSIQKTGSNSSASADDYARMILFYDRQPNAAFPAVADLLTSMTLAGAASSTAADQINLQNRDRFLILRDMRIILPATGINGIAPAVTCDYPDMNVCESKYNIAMFVPLKDLETHYNLVGGGGITNVTTGALNLLTLSSTQASPAAWQLTAAIRVKYFDA